MKKWCKIIFIDVLISVGLSILLTLTNYLTWRFTNNILLGTDTIGGEGAGKSGFGIWVLYDLKNKMQFDWFSFIADTLNIAFLVSFSIFIIMLIMEMKKRK